MKKISILIMALLCITNVSMAYVDLDSSHLAYNDIMQLNKEDVLLGYPDDTFRPDTYITEEELLTIILRGASLDACKSFKNWPDDYIELGINNGIVADESLVNSIEFAEFINKISALLTINNLDKNFANSLSKKAYLLDEINTENEYITRAEAVVKINRLLNFDSKITTKDLPQETEIYYSGDEELNVSTVINSVEAFRYDEYDGKYANVIKQVKDGEHPYLRGRDKNAKGKYIVSIEFDTINNSQYGAWTSYKSLKFENLQVIDAFDLDEIEKQLMNCAYDAVLIKPGETHKVTAFYVVDKIPDELVISRDITTLYDLQTHHYIDGYSFSKINIKF